MSGGRESAPEARPERFSDGSAAQGRGGTEELSRLLNAATAFELRLLDFTRRQDKPWLPQLAIRTTCRTGIGSRRATVAMEIRLLGLVEASHDGHVLPLGGAKPRAVLAILALHANTPVSADRLIEGLWGEQPPATAPKLVQVLVSQLRKQLAGADAEIVTRGRGYELRVDPDAVDALRFERLLASGGNGAHASEALALWRGPPLDDLADEPFAAPEIRRLEELRLRGARGGDRRRAGRRAPRGGARRARRAGPRAPVARAAARPAHARAVSLRSAGGGAGGVPGRPAGAARRGRARAGSRAAPPQRRDPPAGPGARRSAARAAFPGRARRRHWRLLAARRRGDRRRPSCSSSRSWRARDGLDGIAEDAAGVDRPGERAHRRAVPRSGTHPTRSRRAPARCGAPTAATGPSRASTAAVAR